MQFSTLVIILSLSSAGFAAPSSVSNSSSAAPPRRQGLTAKRAANQRRFDSAFCGVESDNFFLDCQAAGGDLNSCNIDADSVFNDCLDGFIAKKRAAAAKRDADEHQNHRRFDEAFCGVESDNEFLDCRAVGGDIDSCNINADLVFNDCLDGILTKRDATKGGKNAKRENHRRFDEAFCGGESDNFLLDCLATGGDLNSCNIDADSVFNDCLAGFIAKRDPTKRDAATDRHENHRRFDVDFCTDESDNFFADCQAAGGDLNSCNIDADSVFNDCLDGFIAKKRDAAAEHENHRRLDAALCAQKSDDFFFKCQAAALADGKDTALCFSDADAVRNDCLNAS
ncbi:hypothetical protein ISF_04504 [Cordyceps fumosorosea ARSEF 2679]|uniref:Uncharacterized protein n=1 Tax=Cordyceps fumosorosea (strain ARSEF 2679) TaxID=1081104 RepID=A0A167WHG0_CORFA|nr:hypothetical protein ISF_04504 [Cordyceps fumosorosea ARSEF 2679]OAA63795.1 hypothetical protein ISF_04504 [Cordyceps fumosorosea ARSEF 2679]